LKIVAEQLYFMSEIKFSAAKQELCVQQKGGGRESIKSAGKPVGKAPLSQESSDSGGALQYAA
jgi:hypothetical protein